MGIKSPQYFKLSMVDGAPMMQYKEAIRDEHYSHCIIIWKKGANCKLDIPKGKPILPPFKTLKDIEELKKGINLCINNLNAAVEDGGEEY